MVSGDIIFQRRVNSQIKFGFVLTSSFWVNLQIRHEINVPTKLRSAKRSDEPYDYDVELRAPHHMGLIATASESFIRNINFMADFYIMAVKHQKGEVLGAGAVMFVRR